MFGKILAASAAARKETQRAVAAARQQGREEGADALLKAGFEDAEFREYFFRAAADELGAGAGRHIEDWTQREIDPTLQERRRVQNAVLQMAQFEMRPRFTEAEAHVVTRVSFQPRDFHFAQTLPKF